MFPRYEFRAETIIQDGRTTWTAVKEIRDWVLTTSLPEIPNEMIVLFLIACRNVVENTKKTIEAYFKIKKQAPEMFNERDIDSDELQKTSQVTFCASLPVRTKDNSVIHCFRLIDTNYRNLELVPWMKLSYMLLAVSQRYNPPNQLIVLSDMTGFGFMHLTCLKVGAIKKFIDFLQDGMPLRLTAIHVLNTNYVFDKIMAIAKIFMRSELVSVIKTHPIGMDMETFFEQYIPAECIPQEMGGTLPPIEELRQKTNEQLRELKPFFEAEEKWISGNKK